MGVGVHLYLAGRFDGLAALFGLYMYNIGT